MSIVVVALRQNLGAASIALPFGGAVILGAMKSRRVSTIMLGTMKSNRVCTVKRYEVGELASLNALPRRF